MKRYQHVIIGVVSTFILLGDISPDSHHIILLIGVCFGSLLPDIDDKCKKYHKNPLLMPICYFNRYFSFNVARILGNRKKTTRNDINSVIIVVIIAFVLYILARILSYIFTVCSYFVPFCTGLCIGGILCVLSNLVTRRGSKLFYPISSVLVRGDINPYNKRDKRVNIFILALIAIIVFESFISLDIITIYTEFNFIYLLVLWSGLIYASNVRTLYPASAIYGQANRINRVMIAMVNKERKKRKIRPVKYDHGLMVHATNWSKKMAREKHLSHSDTHLENCCMVPTSGSSVQITKRMFNTWKTSPLHWSWMMNSSISKMGFGFKRRGRYAYGALAFK